MQDPVFFDGKHWRFYDETWADSYGPYETENDARKALDDYVHYLNTGVLLADSTTS